MKKKRVLRVDKKRRGRTLTKIRGGRYLKRRGEAADTYCVGRRKWTLCVGRGASLVDKERIRQYLAAIQ